MDGVIIFADNNVFKQDSYENALFSKLRSDETFSVLPVDSINNLGKALKTMSTFKALILDWNFEQELDAEDLSEGIRLPSSNPQGLLNDIDIYSLIYVYSQAEISEATKGQLVNKFKDKIKFRTKKELKAIDDEYNSIKRDLDDFENQHKHMEIPFIWSQTINQSVQTIFQELEDANPDWIKEIRDSAKADGSEPTSEIIEIFHNLLNESLIQNKTLREELDKYDCTEQVQKEENTAKLYRRIFYSILTKDAPIMTGDIFKFDDNNYGILITPECEVSKRKDSSLEFLIFSQNDMNEYLRTNNSYKRNEDKYEDFKDKRKETILKIFNNENLTSHILPSFPFSEDVTKESAVINFKSAFAIKDKAQYNGKRIGYKLNAPYIHQLRQRYIAFFGRYGVPAIPNSLKEFNLK